MTQTRPHESRRQSQGLAADERLRRPRSRRQPTPATHAGNLAAHRLAKTSESSTRPAASRSDNATLPTVQPPAGRSDCADVGTAALAGHLGHLQCRR
ncbi:unnamed protein product [Lampetra planeri]